MSHELSQRLLRTISHFTERYPTAWDDVEVCRRSRRKLRDEHGNPLEWWKDWCYLPMGVARGIIFNITREDIKQDGTDLAVLSAWRRTMGIYRFDEDILDSLCTTRIEGEIPGDVFLRLPEWCVYIQTQRLVWVLPGHGRFKIYGFFALLSSNTEGEDYLELVVDREGFSENEFQYFSIRLGSSIVSSLEETCSKNLPETNWGGSPKEHAQTVAPYLSPLVSLTLYLCAANADLGERSGQEPHYPKPKKTKRGLREFPADGPKVWQVGYRIGAAIRKAREQQLDKDSGDGTHASPRAHIRRAHWHLFWTGKRTEPRVPRVKWLPPIPVNVDDERELVPTIHPVKS